jgi:SpoVK/Ycf46/Vps4 family AAA+-type ATPase
MTAGYSGADIANVCRDAAMMGVRRVMEAARKEGLSGADIQKHMINMRDQLATAVTHEVSVCASLHYLHVTPLQRVLQYMLTSDRRNNSEFVGART